MKFRHIAVLIPRQPLTPLDATHGGTRSEHRFVRLEP